MPEPRFDLNVRQARELYAAGQLGPAEALCREVLALRKRDPGALELLAHVAAARGDVDAAFDAARRLVAARPREAPAHRLLGELCSTNGRFRDAVACFEKALRLEPGDPKAAAGKALALHRSGANERARRALRAWTDRQDLSPEMVAVLAAIDLEEGRLEPAIERLESCVDGSDGHEAPAGGAVRQRLLSLLGKARERSGDVERAFAAYRDANAALDARFDPAAHVALVDDLVRHGSAAALAAVPRAADSSPLPVFIVGMPRSGSTLVERIVAAHPLAHGAGEIQDLHLLAQSLSFEIEADAPYPACLADLTQADVDRLAAAHLDRLRRLAPRAARVIDKNLFNALHLGLISRLFPGARVIRCRRDPVDTCLSCWCEPLPATGHPYAQRLDHLGLVHREHDRLMAHWQEVVDLPLLEVVYEELTAEPEAGSRRLVEFCGLEWDARCLEFHEQRGAAPTLSYEQVRKPVYRTAVGRAERFGPLLDDLRSALRPGS